LAVDKLGTALPYGTLVNVVGCFLIALVMPRSAVFAPSSR
jgi:fluoride ion exporter CrcB/FEX